MMWLKISWRSIWRNKRRTIISMFAVGMGLVLMIAYVGMSDWMLADASARMDRTGMGHVQIHAPGYRQERDVALTIEKPGELLARLPVPADARVSSRIIADGLLATAHGSRGAQVLGVDPEAEAGVALSIRDIVDGETLRPNDRRGILVGTKMAERLKVKVGSKVVLTAQRPDGEIATELLRVRGIFGGVAASVSRTTAYVDAAALRSMLEVGDAAHEIVMLLSDSHASDALAAEMRAVAGEQVEIKGLWEFLPVWREMSTMMEGFIWAIVFVVYVLVGLGVLNTMLMSVMERTQEFGMLMAVGLPPRQLILQVLAETAWIATVAVVVGFAGGLAVTAYGEAYGLLDYSAELGDTYEMAGMAIDAKMRSVLSVPRALQTTAVVWLLTMLAGIYPAWRVSRFQPADALRSV